MSTQLGINTNLQLGFESTYGTAPSSMIKMPYQSSSVDDTQSLISDETLGLGRDPQAPARGAVNVNGEITVPLDLRHLGWWLKALLGASSSTGSDPYTHTWTSGAASLPSFTLETQYPNLDTAKYAQAVGCYLSSFNLEMTREGLIAPRLGILGKKVTDETATADASPDTLVFKRFSSFQGSLRKDGTEIGSITRASFTYDNGLDADETLTSDGTIDGAQPGRASLTGQMTSRFQNSTLVDLARSGGAMELQFRYVIDASNQLIITAHEVYLPKTSRSVNGPGGIEIGFDFQASYDAGDSTMLTVALTNDVASYP
ncbi:MAG: hypothetical protein Alpg2KO_31600 [Alphaproteobacteria bacterium]